jgi:hypothetical protein
MQRPTFPAVEHATDARVARGGGKRHRRCLQAEVRRRAAVWDGQWTKREALGGGARCAWGRFIFLRGRQRATAPWREAWLAQEGLQTGRKGYGTIPSCSASWPRPILRQQSLPLSSG